MRIDLRKPTEDDLNRFKECFSLDPDHANPKYQRDGIQVEALSAVFIAQGIQDLECAIGGISVIVRKV